MIAIQGLTAGYGESMVLRELSLNVPQGQVVALMGSNGVGKTTLLKVLMGLIKPRAGEITYEAKPITAWTPYRRAQAGIGYVPQGREIFPFLSVKENLVLGLEARGRKPGKDVDAMLDLFPALKSLLARRGGDLSGGQQQILALARVLLTEPKLLVLDEPTEGIQPSIVDEIGDVLGRLKSQGGLSILLVEQFVDFALRHADYYYVMEHGEVSRQGEVTNDNRVKIQQEISL
jgi:urea transport system ATP-binding protein